MLTFILLLVGITRGGDHTISPKKASEVDPLESSSQIMTDRFGELFLLVIKML